MSGICSNVMVLQRDFGWLAAASRGRGVSAFSNCLRVVEALLEYYLCQGVGKAVTPQGPPVYSRSGLESLLGKPLR